MPQANAVLLPKLFPTDLVSLGQFLRNPLQPNANAYTKSSEKVGNDDVVKGDPEQPYSTIVSTDVRGRFEIALTKLLGAKVHSQRANLLSIEAEKLEYHSLKDVTGTFKRICQDEESKKWISDMTLNKAPCFFVIGIQVLSNAEFKRIILKEGGTGGYLTVPLEATTQIPLHIKGDISAKDFGRSTGTLNGVFGIEVQRLNSKITSAGEPTLDYNVSWHWSYQRVKGTQTDQEKQLSIKLEDVNVDELVKLLEQDDREDEEDEEDVEET